MKKKLLAVLLTAAMTVSLCACGNSETATTAEPAATETTEAATEEAAPAAEAGDETITIWVADAVTDFTKEQCDAFFAANPDYAGYNVVIEAVGEGDAAGNIITDVEGGADIFGFAQDQLTRLVAANALTALTGDYAAFVDDENNAGAAEGSKVGGTSYAFPLTADNGYFLYYDKSVVTDPSTLEGIVADCEAAGKSVYFEINSAWYQTAFFFGTGCKLEYTTDDTGAFTGCDCTYASPEGVVALRAMATLNESPAFQNGSSVSNATNVGAIVDGTWDASAAKDLFGENYACAKLPTFEGSDGKTYQLSGFNGFKLLGVKPQTDANKLAVCLELAKYLSSEEVQLARYELTFWGPSNLKAAANEAVQADEALCALADQFQYTIPQGQYPGDYWSLGTSLGDDIIAGNVTSSASDDDLLAVLTMFQETCESYAQ